MEQSKQEHNIKPKKTFLRRFRWLITLLVVVLVVIGIRQSLKSNWLLNYVKNQIEQVASDQTGMPLTINKIEGDLLKNLVVSDIRFGDDAPLFSADSLFLEYRLGGLFSRRLNIDLIRLSGFEILAEQKADSTWNFPVFEETEEQEETGGLPIAIFLESLLLEDGNIKVESPHLLPESFLHISDFNLMASAMVSNDEYSVELSMLELKLQEGRLPEQLDLHMRAGVEDDIITLETLTMGMGNTFFESSARFNMDSTDLVAEANLDPLIVRDIKPFLPEKPDFERLTLRTTVDGSFSNLIIDLSANSPDFFDASVSAGIQIADELALKQLDLSLGFIDVNRFLDEPMDVSSGSLAFSFDGFIPVDDFESMQGLVNLEINNARFEHISLASFKATTSIENTSVNGNVALSFPGQQIDGNFNLTDVFSDFPSWNVDVGITNVNPGYFANDDELEGRINGTFLARGKGFEPSEEDWIVSIPTMNIVLQPYEADLNELLIILNSSLAEVKGQIASRGAEFNVKAIVEKWDTDLPDWSIETQIRNFDPSIVLALEDLEANLSLDIDAVGTGTDPETMVVDASLFMLPSTFLDQPIDTLSSRINLENNIVRLTETRLVSFFADASLTARQNLGDFTDISNRLDFELEIGDLSPFAPLAGADTLMVAGKLSGNIVPQDGFPNLQVQGELTDILYDEYALNESLLNLSVLLKDEPDISLSWRFDGFMFQEIELSGLLLETDVSILEEEIQGMIALDFLRADEFGIYHRGDFSITDDEIRITTNRLDIVEDILEMELVQPFTVRVIDEDIEMEMLKLTSEIGATLNTSFQKTGDDLHFYLDAVEVNTAYFQQTILDEVIAEGVFTGIIDLQTNITDYIILDFDSRLNDFVFEDLLMDEIALRLHIEDERLSMAGYGERLNERFFEGELDVPFIFEAPEDLPDTFFDEAVNGFFTLNPFELQRFPQAMQAAGLIALEGEVIFDFNLSGTAGNPDLNADFELNQAVASGVSIEQFLMNLSYNPEEAKIMVDSELTSLGQKALELQGYHPLEIDFRRFTVVPFDGTEEISLNLITRDFRLNAFSDFLDQTVAGNLEGLLNANLAVTGTLDNPRVNGDILMSAGRIYLVENNVNFRNIRADIGVQTNRIDLRRISMDSSGSFNLDGFVELSDLSPTNLEINARALNFRVFNTRDIQSYITTTTSLTGSMEQPQLVGELLIERGYIYLDNFGDGAIEEVQLDDEEPADTMIADFIDALAVEMNLRIDRRFFVRNRNRPELELEVQGNLDLVKEAGEEFLLFGDAQAVRGYANQLGRRFDLERGVLLFSGDPGNPDLDVRLAYRLRREDDITIWYVVGGTLEEPEFTYESEPEMDLQDIISYTIFGRPFHGLQGWQQGMSGGGGNVVADAAIDLLLDRLESIVADRFGVDVIEISQSSGSGATTVKAGKYLSDRLFVALVQELSTDSDSQVIIEYLLRRNLELILTSSTDYRTGIDIIWRHDY